MLKHWALLCPQASPVPLQHNSMAALGRQPPATAPGQKTNFNALPRPSNYVPGLGRGATGGALLLTPRIRGRAQ